MATAEIAPVVALVGKHVDDPCISVEDVTGRTCLFFFFSVDDLMSPPLVMESQSIMPCRDMLRLPCCSWTMTEDNACIVLCECIFACVCTCVCLSLCAPVRVIDFEVWNLDRVPGYPRRQETTGPQQPSLSSFFFPPSTFPSPILSHSTRQTTFNLTSLTPCDFHLFLWWFYWYVTLIFIAGQNGCCILVRILMWVNKRQACLVICFHSYCSLYCWDIPCVKVSCIGKLKKKNTMCEMERSQGTLQIFNIVEYWHSLQSIHSPITYCPPPCVFSVYRYCIRKGMRK